MSGKGKGGRGKGKGGGKAVSRSARAGLQFPVPQMDMWLKRSKLEPS